MIQGARNSHKGRTDPPGSGQNPPAYDTLYTYDLNGNVATRKQGGQITGTPGTYTGGTLSDFTYNGDNRETSMNVDANDAGNGVQPHRAFTTGYWPSGQPQTSTRLQCTTAPCTGTPITESYYYNSDGRISQDTRTSDSKNQTYSYDTNGNRSADETGGHLYNALNQEVQWTRGSSPILDQANGGSTVSYLLDGTGGLLRQIDSAGGLASDGTQVPITTWYCSASTIGSVSGTTSKSTSYSTGCQHDADRVEVVNSVSGDSGKVPIANPTANYCYNSLAQLTRVTVASCPADDAAMQSLTLNVAAGETASSTAVYQHDSFGDQTTVKAPDPNSSASNPSIDTASYSYDALDRRYAKSEQIASSWSATATPQPSTYGYIGQSNQIAIETNPDPSAPLTLVPHSYDYNSTGQKLGFWQGASTANPAGVYHTYAIDAKGSIEALENANNTIDKLNRYHYTPYGNLEKGLAQGGGNPTSTTTVEQSLGTDARTNNYRFEGFYLDSGVATYDLQARNYRPQDGLYTTQDTFEQALGDQALRSDPLTQNLYAFAGGNPTSNIEWDGHLPNCLGAPGQVACQRAAGQAMRTLGQNAVCGGCLHQQYERSVATDGGQAVGVRLQAYAALHQPPPPTLIAAANGDIAAARTVVNRYCDASSDRICNDTVQQQQSLVAQLDTALLFNQNLNKIKFPTVSSENGSTPPDLVIVTGSIAGIVVKALGGVIGGVIGDLLGGGAAESTAGGIGPVLVGQAGENAVRAAYDIGPKVTEVVNGRTRIFDGLTGTTVSEVKNVGYQGLTRQLQDYIDYAAANRVRFDLFVRPNTDLSGPLQDAIAARQVNLRYIP